MLVLSRGPGESLVIGDDIVIHVVKVERGKVRLGIMAPNHVPVDRAEIWLKKQHEQKGESK